MAREAWEEQPSPYRSVVEFVQYMQAQIDTVTSIVNEQVQVAQPKQHPIYNCSAQPREFSPSDRMLLLVPLANCKFLAYWQGPYTVVKRVDPVSYHLQ